MTDERPLEPPRRGLRRGIQCVVGFILLSGFAVFGMAADVQLRNIDKLYERADDIKPAPVAIVLGASVNSKGEPSDALRDRLLVGLSLYERGLVENILISGDDGAYHVDEIESMRNFLIERGVPSERIIEDGHGYRTYESCKRAKQEFGVNRAIVVTQRFHIGRALYLCNRMGIDAWGVASDLTTYQKIVFFTFRDLAASVAAWWDVNVRTPDSPVAYRVSKE